MSKFGGLVKKNWTYLVGAIVGAIGGYIYWAQIGCLTGNCPLQATPWLTILWGTLAGMLVFSFFKKKTE